MLSITVAIGVSVAGFIFNLSLSAVCNYCPLGSNGLSENPVKCGRERLLFFGAVGFWAARLHTCGAKLVHKITYGQALSHVLLRVLFASRINRPDPFPHKERGQRNICGEGYIPRFCVLGDVLVSYVWPSFYVHGRNEAVAGWSLEMLIRHQDGLYLKS